MKFRTLMDSRWQLLPLSWGLAVLSVSNTIYTLSRTRKYRLFQSDIDVKPNTTSVRRVRVDSTAVTASPLRFISDMISSDTAESRAHPEKDRDVWELSIWDPLPVCVRFMCLFSPGHVLIYLIFLPLAPLEPRPSIALFNALVMQAVLSAQMIFLSLRYTQQAKDSAIIQKEVFHEYDTKFVQPRIHPIVRDVGTQISEDQPPVLREFVQVGTPTTLIRKAFISTTGSGNAQLQRLATPVGTKVSTTHSNRDSPSLRHSLPAGYTAGAVTPFAHTPTGYAAAGLDRYDVSTPVAPPSVSSIGTSTSLRPAHSIPSSVLSRAKSPLKKAISMGDMNVTEVASFRMSGDNLADEQRSYEPATSPIKRPEAGRFTGMSPSSSPHPFANMGKHSAVERFPKRWRA